MCKVLAQCFKGLLSRKKVEARNMLQRAEIYVNNSQTGEEKEKPSLLQIGCLPNHAGSFLVSQGGSMKADVLGCSAIL